MYACDSEREDFKRKDVIECEQKHVNGSIEIHTVQ